MIPRDGKAHDLVIVWDGRRRVVYIGGKRQ